MAAVLVALIAVAGFALVLVKSQVIAVARSLTGTAVAGVSAMLDSTLDDTEKERAVQRAGIDLLKVSWQVAWRFALAIAAVALPIVLADAAGLVPGADSLGVLLRVDFILIVSVLAIAAAWFFARRRGGQTAGTADASAYGAGDRMIHALAFAGPGMIKGAARLDDRLFAGMLRQVPDRPPVFITSLARGGTTALLNAMHDLPQIATHRYCDMPFVAAPMLWSRLAGGKRSVSERERAHGDGMKIGLQSPEAFDEIFWMLHWPEKYHEARIDLWHTGDARAAATEFFTGHFRKIARLRQGAAAEDGTVRYMSKNNANIARLDLLPTMFPGCHIVVPLRDPAAHAASLHRQHMNFLKLHAEDSFALRYMRDIGHLEFGALQRAIGFDPAALDAHSPETPDYWLTYWIGAFEAVARHAETTLLVTQDDLREQPQETMLALMDRLDLSDGRDRAFDQYFRRTPDKQPDDLFETGLLGRARALYGDLAPGAVR